MITDSAKKQLADSATKTLTDKELETEEPQPHKVEMELDEESPPEAGMQRDGMVKLPRNQSLADESTPMTQTMTMPPPPPMMTPGEKRFRALEQSVNRTATRQEDLESTAQKLVTALSTAVAQLEQQQQVHGVRLTGRETVMESQNQNQHLLWNKAKDVTQAQQNAVQMTRQQQNEYEHRLENTRQQMEHMVKEYQAAQAA